jgi:type IV fimbrial biogenesis protein FimT
MRHPVCEVRFTPERTPRRAGFTLIELMIVMAIGVLLLVIGVPQYADWRASRELANEAQQLALSMNLARSEAIKRGYRVNLCRTTNAQQCEANAGWEGGWIVYVDIDRNGRRDDDEPVLRVEQGNATGIRVIANRPLADYVSYTSLGSARLLNGALQMGSFTLCRSGLRTQRVVLANSGRVRIETGTVTC